MAKKKLVTQEDYYLAAVAAEEQGERWLRSDVAKSVRQYERAMELYRSAMALDGDNGYDVQYNLCRVPLQLYLEFGAVGGSGECGVPELDIGGITRAFEELDAAYGMLEARAKWDLTFNLLTCYLCMAEDDDCELGGGFDAKCGSAVARLLSLSADAPADAGASADTNSISLVKCTDASPDAFADTFSGASGDAPLNVSEDALLNVADSIDDSTSLDTLLLAYRILQNLKERELPAHSLHQLLDSHPLPQNEELHSLRTYCRALDHLPTALHCALHDPAALIPPLRLDLIQRLLDSPATAADLPTQWALACRADRDLHAQIAAAPNALAKLPLLAHHLSNEHIRAQLAARRQLPLQTLTLLNNNQLTIHRNIATLAVAALKLPGVTQTARRQLHAYQLIRPPSPVPPM